MTLVKPPRPLVSTRHQGLKTELERLERALPTGATILVLGAPGTGKDRLAGMLHQRSHRPSDPFVRIDLATLSEDLFESELFGHERGAFTGATAAKPGLLEGAANGTIYLDRIDLVSPRSQGKLLRVLEERTFRRVGGTRQINIQARFIASAFPDLARKARSGEFREDLYYRIAVVTVVLPPLTDRLQDLEAAVRGILRNERLGTTVNEDVRKALRNHPWRGNWRELENVISRATIEIRARGGNVLELSDLSMEPFTEPETFLRPAMRAGWTLSEVEKRYIELVLQECGGNVSEAARKLGISRKKVYERFLKNG